MMTSDERQRANDQFFTIPKNLIIERGASLQIKLPVNIFLSSFVTDMNMKR